MDLEELNKATISSMRAERNKLLTNTDKYLLPDYPIIDTNLELIKSYRQDLRDFMKLEGVYNYNWTNTPNETPQFPPFPENKI